jgi:RNA polymerase sigma-70 factor, ECF subfamily
MPPGHGTSPAVIRALIERRDIDENFHRLFLIYHSAVTRYFLRKGLSADDCRDLTQETFVAVYAGIGGLRSPDAFVAWLFSIARNVALRHSDLRRRRSRIEAEAPAGYPTDEPVGDLAVSPHPDPLDSLLEQEKVDAIRDALEALPDRVRDCLRARLLDGLNYREIGERLGISENTVAVHLHRGTKSLKERLKRFAARRPIAEDV